MALRSREGSGRRIDLIAVFAGGMVGTLGRAAMTEAWPVAPGSWPWATFAVNLAGAALLGWATVALSATGPSRPFVGTGVCGALTTFSALQLELYELVDGDHLALAAGYLVASVALGLAAVVAGRRLAPRTPVPWR